MRRKGLVVERVRKSKEEHGSRSRKRIAYSGSRETREENTPPRISSRTRKDKSSPGHPHRYAANTKSERLRDRRRCDFEFDLRALEARQRWQALEVEIMNAQKMIARLDGEVEDEGIWETGNAEVSHDWNKTYGRGQVVG
ncbi:hypothetical protein BU25DRAFT_478009 [Macroventuria anomochaeta]|uniref:Uncharacterized protein n=1 Tax=Macroventuria anomochaeta TaxID=301207 RepID=A0ACB6RNC8_9PLEO|nr:uncharacterized protein BU25DRAFT_478009 [Macroventuria anomochaeta]KAF2623541.1 hypothetical protein BU25DRAFT_478009 [Macroventuria anomochaeta]